MASNPETTRKLIFSILQFLQSSLDNGTVRSDDKEGVEVAVQCIGEAFDVSPSDSTLSVSKPLQEIFAAHLSSTSSASTSSSKPSASAPSSAPKTQPSPTDISEAEKLKASGNALMSSKQYQPAIDAYTQAIDLNPQNPVYFSNRAAAHSSLGDHSAAAEDAELALAADPGFAKAYSRLGHARYSLKQYSKAASAFRKGLELDGGNANMRTGLENAEARMSEDPAAAEAEENAEDDDEEAIDPRQAAAGGGAGGMGGFDMSRAAEMLQGLGGGAGMGAGGAGGGGMPDLSGLMNNPQIMQAAQSMMANGGLEQLMNNPMMRNLASQFMQGQGRGAGGAP